jgi:hypothetical protein
VVSLPATPAPWHADAPVPATAPRTRAWNLGWEDKHFVVNNGVDKPMSAGLIGGSDALHGLRLRSLMSVDDYLGAAMELLEAAGADAAALLETWKSAITTEMPAPWRQTAGAGGSEFGKLKWFNVLKLGFKTASDTPHFKLWQLALADHVVRASYA